MIGAQRLVLLSTTPRVFATRQGLLWHRLEFCVVIPHNLCQKIDTPSPRPLSENDMPSLLSIVISIYCLAMFTFLFFLSSCASLSIFSLVLLALVSSCFSVLLLSFPVLFFLSFLRIFYVHVFMASGKNPVIGSSLGGGPSRPYEPSAPSGASGAATSPNVNGGISRSIFEGHRWVFSLSRRKLDVQGTILISSTQWGCLFLANKGERWASEVWPFPSLSFWLYSRLLRHLRSCSCPTGVECMTYLDGLLHFVATSSGTHR